MFKNMMKQIRNKNKEAPMKASLTAQSITKPRPAPIAPQAPMPTGIENPSNSPQSMDRVSINPLKLQMPQAPAQLPAKVWDQTRPVPMRPNQGGVNRFENIRQQLGLQAPQAPAQPPQAPIAPLAPAPVQPAIVAPQAPVAPQASIAPQAPAPIAPAPIQQQKTPGTSEVPAAPVDTVSPEDQFKKAQSSLYQINK